MPDYNKEILFKLRKEGFDDDTILYLSRTRTTGEMRFTAESIKVDQVELGNFLDAFFRGYKVAHGIEEKVADVYDPTVPMHMLKKPEEKKKATGEVITGGGEMDVDMEFLEEKKEEGKLEFPSFALPTEEGAKEVGERKEVEPDEFFKKDGSEEWARIEEIKLTPACQKGLIVIREEKPKKNTPIGDLDDYRETREKDFIRRESNKGLFDEEAIDTDKLNIAQDLSQNKVFQSPDKLEEFVRNVENTHSMKLEKSIWSSDTGQYAFKCCQENNLEGKSKECPFTVRFYRDVGNDGISLKYGILEHNHGDKETIIPNEDSQECIKYFDAQDVKFKEQFMKIPNEIVKMGIYLAKRGVQDESIFEASRIYHMSTYSQDVSFNQKRLCDVLSSFDLNEKDEYDKQIDSLRTDEKDMDEEVDLSDSNIKTRPYLEQSIYRMTKKKPKLFLKALTENDGRVLAMFICDQSRVKDMNYLNDAVSFDTGYKDLFEDMPIMVFSCLDNHGFSYPLAICVFWVQNSVCIQWALRMYNEAGYRSPETVITDRDADLKSVISSIWPKSKHVFSIFHLYHNMLKCCKNKTDKKVNQFKKDFMECVKSTTVECVGKAWTILCNSYNSMESDQGPDFMKEIWKHRYHWARQYTNDAFLSGMQSKDKDMSLRDALVKRVKCPKNQACTLVSIFCVLQEEYFRRLKREILVARKMKYEGKIYSKLKNKFPRFIIKKIEEMEKKSDSKDLIIVTERTKEGIRYPVLEDGKTRKRYKLDCGNYKCQCGRLSYMGIPCEHLIKILREDSVDWLEKVEKGELIHPRWRL
ncbi:unnamed protein product [Moneuplotes crassus]|uniref:SWIM-type domain-containing protein n=1 Tax=Euplotes crassus TaxID=5936 RepID=A0AAD2D881_EUPCR|nr:unnamed protein product [Moneuplotes crassus]